MQVNEASVQNSSSNETQFDLKNVYYNAFNKAFKLKSGDGAEETQPRLSSYNMFNPQAQMHEHKHDFSKFNFFEPTDIFLEKNTANVKFEHSNIDLIKVAGLLT